MDLKPNAVHFFCDLTEMKQGSEFWKIGWIDEEIRKQNISLNDYQKLNRGKLFKE